MTTQLDQPRTTPSLPTCGERPRVAGGATFNVCDYKSVVSWLEHAASQAPEPAPNQRGRYVCVANVTDVMDARKDASYSQALEASDLTVPDGAPVVWALRLAGFDIRRRVYGPTLMQQALETEAIATKRHVLIAGMPEAREGVRRRFSEVNWAGEIDFQFNQLDDAAYAEIARQLADMQADYAWVSLGGGKQVRFMHRIAPLAPHCVMLGVGAAFDFHAGLLPQAPKWMQENGLEWLFRLGCEPRRLWHRYLVHNPPFLYHLLKENLFRKTAEA